MYKASCLCGNVKYEIHGKIMDIVHCHCSRCRRVQGSSHATNGNVHNKDFKLLCDMTQLTAYETVPGNHKYFCKTCGSPMFSKNNTTPELTRIRIGSIESDITERPIAHVFVDSKANWDEICDELPQHSEYIITS